MPYPFGEAVSNAKVKYRVYHSPHDWWDEDGGGDEGGGMGADAGDDNAALGYDAAQQSEQTGKLDANGKLTTNVPTQYVADLKRPTDQVTPSRQRSPTRPTARSLAGDAFSPPAAASASTSSR